MSVIKKTWEIVEEAHPFLEGLRIRTLLSKRDEGGNATCVLVRCPIGAEIEEHVHEEQSDLVYVLEGEATMWVEEVGEFQLIPGTFIAVEKGKRHRTFNVKDDLLIYSVFVPPTF